MTAAQNPEPTTLPPKDPEVTVKVPRDLWDALRMVAERHHRSTAAELRYVLTEYVRPGRRR